LDYGDCENCKVAVLGGFVLDLCKDSGKFTVKEKISGLSCRSLRRKFEKDEISAIDLIFEVRPRLSEDDKERLEDVLKAARESGVELEGLEDDGE